MRKIVHIDMDAFYAAVEQRDHPELAGRPVIVGWSQEARGVVVAASYEARRFGVRSAMPAARATRRCPQAVWLRPDFDRYREVSSRLRVIFRRHTALVEPLGLDEAYLDVTEDLTGLPTATATSIALRRRIREETGLTASAGVAANKFLAKIASDWNKPDGLFVIKPHHVEAFLPPLPVTRLPGVGRATRQLLAAQGVTTVGDLRRLEVSELWRLLGKLGQRLWELSRGIDDRPVVAHRQAKSISSESTFGDLALSELAGPIERHARQVWEVAGGRRRPSIGARTVTVKLRTADYRTATRQITPAQSPASADELVHIACHLLDRFPFPPEVRFRLAGVGLSNFRDEEGAEGSASLTADGGAGEPPATTRQAWLFDPGSHDTCPRPRSLGGESGG